VLTTGTAPVPTVREPEVPTVPSKLSFNVEIVLAPVECPPAATIIKPLPVMLLRDQMFCNAGSWNGGDVAAVFRRVAALTATLGPTAGMEYSNSILVP
jgi:hypothetical protein